MSQNILLCNKCGATKPPGNAKNCWKPECDGTYVTTPIAHPTPRTQNIHNRWDEPDEEEVETPRFRDRLPNFGSIFAGNIQWIMIGIVTLGIIILGAGAYLTNRGTPEPEFTLIPLETIEAPTEETSPEPTAIPNTPPEAPRADTHAIDAGSTSWKGSSQWLQITFLIATIILLFVDTSQKLREIKDDTRRGGGQQIRLKTIWAAPVLVVLGALILVGSEWQFLQPALFGVGHKLAIVYALICWIMAYIVAEGDLSFPAGGLTITALWHLIAINKTGALLSAFKIPPTSVMFNLGNTFDLLTLNQVEMAKFSLLIYSLLIVAAYLLGRSLLRSTDHRDPNSLIGIAVAIVGGIAIFAAGRWIDPVWSLVILMGAGLLGQIRDIDNFDEGLMGGIIVGTLLTLAAAVPI